MALRLGHWQPVNRVDDVLECGWKLSGHGHPQRFFHGFSQTEPSRRPGDTQRKERIVQRSLLPSRRRADARVKRSQARVARPSRGLKVEVEGCCPKAPER